MHEEIIYTMTDLDKQRRGYHEEEHVAKQARDKEDKYVLTLIPVRPNP